MDSIFGREGEGRDTGRLRSPHHVWLRSGARASRPAPGLLCLVHPASPSRDRASAPLCHPLSSPSPPARSKQPFFASPFPQPVNSVNSVNSAVSDSCILLRGEIDLLNPQRVPVPPPGSHRVPTWLPAPQGSPWGGCKGSPRWCRQDPPSTNASTSPGTGLEPSCGQGKGAQQGDKARFNILFFFLNIFVS